MPRASAGAIERVVWMVGAAVMGYAASIVTNGGEIRRQAQDIRALQRGQEAAFNLLSAIAEKEGLSHQYIATITAMATTQETAQ